MKKRMYMRRPIAVCMSLFLAAGLLGGCTGKGNGTEAKSGGDSAKGRYVEKDMELPTGEGEEILNLERSKDGNPVLFSHIDGTDISRYEYKDGKWEKTSMDWVNELYKGKEIYPEIICETEDGAQIFKGAEPNMLSHMAKSSDGKTGEELEISWLKEESDFGYPAVTDVRVDREGNYWLMDFYNAKVMVISPDTLKVKEEINCVQCFNNDQKVVFTGENGNMAVNTEDGVFTVYNSELGEEGTFKTDTGPESSGFLCGGIDNWYYISKAGITRLTQGNDLSEILMDGSMGTMGSSMNIITGSIKGADDDFYVLYREEKTGSASLMHYVYDETVAAAPEHTLRIFGLSENETVQNAAVGFQKAHPEVKVEFQTSGSEENVSADDIRTLNTELLGGNGADILLLDGLPTDAYIEKGILADMTELAGELMKQDEYLEAVLKNTAEKDGKLYGLPVKFSVPIIYGDTERKEALRSIETLSDYLEKNPDEAIFGMADKEYICNFLFQLYQEEILSEDGSIDQDKLNTLFEIEKKLAVNAKADVLEELNSNESAWNTFSAIFQQGAFINPASSVILNHPESIATDQIGSLPGMMLPYAVMRKLDVTPETIRDFYIPHGIVGINQSTEEKGIAEEFIKYLFSQETQGAQLDDGLPVLTSVLNGLGEEADTEYARSFAGGSALNIDGEEEINIDMGYPERSEVEALVEKCSMLKNPVVQDFVIWNIYQTEANRFLDGETDAGTAVKNIAQKIDTYHAE